MRVEGGGGAQTHQKPKATKAHQHQHIPRARLGRFLGESNHYDVEHYDEVRALTRRGVLFFCFFGFCKYAHEYALMGFPSVLKSCRAVEEVRVISIGSGLPTFHIKCYLLACCCRRRALIPKASRSRYMDALHFCSRICRRQQRMPLLHPHTYPL